MNNIPRRFKDTPEGFEEVPAFIPAGTLRTFTLNPKWQQALWEMDDTGRVEHISLAKSSQSASE